MKLAICIFIAGIPCLANAGLIAPSLAQNANSVLVADTLTPVLADELDDPVLRAAKMLADPAFQEQQRLLFQQLAIQIEELTAALKVADDYADCRKHAERADCVQQKADNAQQQETTNLDSVDALGFVASYVDFAAEQQTIGTPLSPMVQVSEPSLFALAFLVLLARMKTLSSGGLAKRKGPL